MKSNKVTKLTVEQNPDNEVPKKILADAIVKISSAFNKLRASGLKREAIVILIHASCGTPNVSKRQVRLVLDNLEKLRENYTTI